ncbi:uncharacterized protein LOC106152928 [Lingula anatina]|uniref:Uncharacterized protein LOC106152928 n=1 Tax=Lingula anatina TaxID=7574 RepID=A0A1S3H803_LINAN|nr:uncharacterized protein LOC106152928 [Lingula anatina]|eukprot:XP_013382128.1 uncharacterized protein LOC106152928 [Lingula anatina]
MSEERCPHCCSCFTCLVVLAVGVCGWTFGIGCLQDDDRATRGYCSGVVSRGAAITLIIMGTIAMALILCCCCIGCCTKDGALDTRDPIRDPPPYQESNLAFWTEPSRILIRDIRNVRQVAVVRLGYSEI